MSIKNGRKKNEIRTRFHRMPFDSKRKMDDILESYYKHMTKENIGINCEKTKENMVCKIFNVTGVDLGSNMFFGEDLIDDISIITKKQGVWNGIGIEEARLNKFEFNGKNMIPDLLADVVEFDPTTCVITVFPNSRVLRYLDIECKGNLL